MKINNIIMTISSLLLLSTNISANDGATLFNQKCAACHITTPPSDFSKLVAPPVMGIMRHVKMSYPEKEDAVKFIVEYALNPDENKAVCMAQKIKRFGLMPSQKGNVTAEELRLIASWMYDNYPSKNFRGMGKNNQNMRSCETK